ncbi:MAG: HI0074 family nucleotidyltransferase substrate-binding subunit [Nitrospirota bacterium]
MVQGKELFERDFIKFKKALKKLDEICQEPVETEIIRDATIQRFEFTFESAWKCLKRMASLEGLECFSPKSCFEIGYKMGLVEDEDMFIEIINCRNQTTHIYDEMMAMEIYTKIKDKFCGAFKSLGMKMGEWIEKGSPR